MSKELKAEVNCKLDEILCADAVMTSAWCAFIEDIVRSYELEESKMLHKIDLELLKIQADKTKPITRVALLREKIINKSLFL